MAIIDRNGVIGRDLSFYVDELERVFKAAWGDDLLVGPETAQGQAIGLLAVAYDELDAGVVNLSNGKNLRTAFGYQLDDIGTYLNNRRKAGTNSTVTVTFTGTNTTVIPAGTRVQTSELIIFSTISAATIPSSGTVDVACQSVDIGPIPAMANSLNSLTSPISGVASVNNSEDAILGRNVEPDSLYRQRLETQSMVNSSSFIEAIFASVSNVPGVQRVRILSDDDDDFEDEYVGGVHVPSGSIRVVVQGGEPRDIALAIRNSKTGGIPTAGNESYVYTFGQDQSVTYRFDRVDEIPLTITMRIELRGGFPSNGISQIKTSLLNWVNNLLIGERVDKGRIYEALNPIPGYVVQPENLTIKQPQTPGSPTLVDVTTPNANQLFKLNVDQRTNLPTDISITTVV